MSTLISGTGTEYVIGQGAVATDYDKNVKAINHRGYTATGYGDNTINAFRTSKLLGFNYVETDIRFTSDDVCVLCHDGTTGGLTISESTYADLVAANPNLARFDDFIGFCRDAIIHPYIEIKAGTAAQIADAVTIVKSKGLLKKCSWISTGIGNLNNVLSADSSARIGILGTLSAALISSASALKTPSNEVFLDVSVGSVSAELVASCISADIPLEVYTVNSANSVLALDYYVTGVTSDTIHAGKVLFDARY